MPLLLLLLLGGAGAGALYFFNKSQSFDLKNCIYQAKVQGLSDEEALRYCKAQAERHDQPSPLISILGVSVLVGAGLYFLIKSNRSDLRAKEEFERMKQSLNRNLVKIHKVGSKNE